MGEFDTETDLFQGGTLRDCFVRAKLLPAVPLDESHACSDDPIINDYSIYYSICYNQSIIVFYNSVIKTKLGESNILFEINYVALHCTIKRVLTFSVKIRFRRPADK